MDKKRSEQEQAVLSLVLLSIPHHQAAPLQDQGLRF